MLAREDIDDLLKRHANVRSTGGDKIGSISQAYADDIDGRPSWVTVKTGLFGVGESFVPLEGARLDGDDMVVPYSKDQVKDAPRMEVEGHLEPAGEERLYAHCQLTGAPRTYTEALAGGYDDAGGTMGGKAPGLAAGDALTRSEERLNPGPGRLREYITSAIAAPARGGGGKRIEAGGGDDTRR